MSIVERFEAELQKHSSPKFGQWYAVDLHNHSPASSDFQGNRDTAIEDAIAHLRATSVSLVMFTDHGRLPDPDFTDQVAARSGKVVLRGAELNVFVDAWQKPANKVEKTAFFHLLIGFDPDASESADYWFTDLERRCRRETRIIGGKEIAGFVDPIDNICDTLEESGAIVIPAHLHTKHDAFKSRSVDDIYADPEFLRVARERFTALEVTDPATAGLLRW